MEFFEMALVPVKVSGWGDILSCLFQLLLLSAIPGFIKALLPSLLSAQMSLFMQQQQSSHIGLRVYLTLV